MANNSREPLGKSQNFTSPQIAASSTVSSDKPTPQQVSTNPFDDLSPAPAGRPRSFSTGPSTPGSSAPLTSSATSRAQLIQDAFGVSAEEASSMASRQAATPAPKITEYQVQDMSAFIDSRRFPFLEQLDLSNDPAATASTNQDTFNAWRQYDEYHDVLEANAEDLFQRDLVAFGKTTAARNANHYIASRRAAATANYGIELGFDATPSQKFTPPVETASVSSDEFEDVQAPPPAVEEKPATSWWKEVTTMHMDPIRLADEDRNLLRRTIDAANAGVAVAASLPAKMHDAGSSLIDRIPNAVSDSIRSVKSNLKSGASDLFAHLTQVNLPKGLKKFIMFFLEVLPLAMCDDRNVWIASQLRLTYVHGLFGAALIDAVALFVQQILKRTEAVRQQVDGDEEDQATIYTSVSAIVSAIHFYTLGWLPENVPKHLISAMIAANVAFTLGRNLEHFAEFILKMIRMGVDAVWWMCTGRPWFDQDQRILLNDVARAIAKMNDMMHIRSPNHDIIAAGRELCTHADTTYGIALANNIKADTLLPLKNVTASFKIWLRNMAGPAENAHPRNPSVISALNGEAGSGKTTFTYLVIAGLMKRRGYFGSIGELVTMYYNNVNFQPPLPTRAKFLVMDDSLLMVDNQAHIEVFNYLGMLGSSTPIMRDSPFENKGLEYEDYDFTFLLNNVVGQVPTNSQQAIGRRIIGGSHSVTTNTKYTKSTNPAHLDFDKLPKAYNKAVLDDIWILEDHLGIKRNYSQYLDMLDAVKNKVADGSRQLDTLITSVAENATGPGSDIVISPPPLKFQSKPVVGVDSNTALRFQKRVRAKNQTLTNKCTQEDLTKWLYNKGASIETNDAFAARILRFMKGTTIRYEFTADKKMLRNGEPVTSKTLWSEYIPNTTPKKADIDIPIKDWSHATIEAMREERFIIKKSCARHNDFCYRHGRHPCPSWDDDAVETNNIGLAHWVLENSDLEIPQYSYFQLVGSVYSPLEESAGARALRLVIISIGTVATGLLILQLINGILNTYKANKVREQSAYTNTGLKRAPARPKGQEFNVPNFTQNPVRPQTDEVKPEEGTHHDWILKKFRDNVIPVMTEVKQGTRKCSMIRIIGNLAATVGHVFDTEATKLHIGGLIAKSYHIRFISHPSELEKNSIKVQVWRDRVEDLAILVLPKSINACKDILKFLVIAGETKVDALTGIVLMVRSLEPFPIENKDGVFGPIEPRRPEPLTAFPLGDADCIRRYESTMNLSGLAVHYVTETADGWCGYPAFTTNVRVGRNCSIVPGFLCSISDKGVKRVFLTTLPQETVTKFIDAAPPDTLSLVRMQSLPEFPPFEGKWVDNMTVIGELPKEDTQFMNHHNSIREIHEEDPLLGFTYVHPSTGETRTVGPTPYGPSPIWQRTEPFLKYQLNDHVPEPEIFDAYKAAGKEMEAQIRMMCDPKLLAPRDKLFSLDEALNGIPELGIPKLDWRKALGYPPVKMLKKLRKELLDIEDNGHMSLKLQYVIIYDNLIHDILHKKMRWVHVVAALKEELRKLGKNARVTCTFPFLVTLAIRTFTLTIPAILISGRLANGIALGADMDGVDGQQAYAAKSQFTNNVNLDAENYDARKSSAYSSVSEEVMISLGLTVMPFLDWDIMSIPVRWSRICLLIVGRIVCYIAWSMLSGHVLTTPLNCTDSGALLITAWNQAHPKGIDGEDLHGQYFRNAYSLVYGDDSDAASNTEEFTNFAVRDTSAALGHKHTPGSKTGEMAKWTPYKETFFLKKLEWVDTNGKVHSCLDPSTLEHIHLFIRGKTVNPRADISIIQLSALQEWAKLGEPIFEAVKARLNTGLAKLKCPPLTYKYTDYYSSWSANHHMAPLTVRHQSANTPVPIKAPETAVDTMQEGSTRSIMNAQSMARDPTSGIATRVKLNTTVTDAVVAVSMRMGAANSIPHGLNPLPPSGVDGVLGRQYPLAVGNWLTSVVDNGNIASFSFPEAMFAIPKIASSLQGIKFVECTILLEISVSGSPFAAGQLRFTHLPVTGASGWRNNTFLHANSKCDTIDATCEGMVQIALHWCSNRTYYDLVTEYPPICNGFVSVDVDSQLKWNMADPPTSLPFTIKGSFDRIVTTGFDVNAAPTVYERGRSWDVAKSAPLKARHQSATEEAAAKASSGVLDGISSAVKTVTGIIKEAGPLIEMAALDKPFENASVVPVRITSGSDMAHTNGVAQSSFLSMPTMAYVTKGNNMMSEANADPTWDQILGIPARVMSYDIPTNLVAGQIVRFFPVWPTMALECQPDCFVPGALAWWASQHELFHGGINFSFEFISTGMQTATYKIIYLPTARSAAIADNQGGDVRSREITIAKGKSIVPLQCEMNTAEAQLETGTSSLPPDSTLGGIIIQCVKPVRAPTLGTEVPIKMFINMSGAPGLVLSNYCGWKHGQAYSFTPLTPPEILERLKDRKTKVLLPDPSWEPSNQRPLKARQQSCIREFHGNAFPTISPANPKTHSNMVDPDRTRGPIETMKRFCLEFYGAPTPSIDHDLIDQDTTISANMSAWAYWSGSLIRKIVVSGNGFPGTGMLTTTRHFLNTTPTNATSLDSACGSVFTSVGQNPFHTYAMPFNNKFWANEYEDQYGNWQSTYVTQYRGPGTQVPPTVGAATVDIHVSVGDDFALYHFMAYPFLISTDTVLKKMEEKRERSKSRRPPPPPSPSDSDSDEYGLFSASQHQDNVRSTPSATLQSPPILGPSRF